MGIKIYHVDSFTNEIFHGNPAGVCLLQGAASDQWMQSVAMEMNLPETAFLYREGEGFNLRWFTPEAEVELCGHATLASAHILWEAGVLNTRDEAAFFTKSGRLSAKKDGEYITLDFPVEEDHEVEPPVDLIKALGVTAVYVGRNRMDYIVEVESESVVKALKPDFDSIKKIYKRGVIVTSRSTNTEYDFVSRFFAPGIGIPEDPVTGSAHCCLGPYWKKRIGKDKFVAYQASKRGGILNVTVNGDRVLIAGNAVTVFCTEYKGEVIDEIGK